MPVELKLAMNTMDIHHVPHPQACKLKQLTSQSRPGLQAAVWQRGAQHLPTALLLLPPQHPPDGRGQWSRPSAARLQDRTRHVERSKNMSMMVAQNV
jgi:hypothetical protein